MVGEGITNHLDNGLLAQSIHLCHRVDLSFEFYPGGITEVNLLNSACFFGRRDGHA